MDLKDTGLFLPITAQKIKKAVLFKDKTPIKFMVPYKGTLTIPQVNPALCIGCGGCESICPVRPMRAIMIKPNVVHKKVNKPKAQQEKKVEVDDFGF